MLPIRQSQSNTSFSPIFRYFFLSPILSEYRNFYRKCPSLTLGDILRRRPSERRPIDQKTKPARETTKNYAIQYLPPFKNYPRAQPIKGKTCLLKAAAHKSLAMRRAADRKRTAGVWALDLLFKETAKPNQIWRPSGPTLPLLAFASVWRPTPL